MTRLVPYAAAVVLLLGGCGTAENDPDNDPGPGPVATAAVSGDFSPIDVQFAQQLVPHHREGIELARLGAVRVQRPELRTLAEAIVATQQDEVILLTGWLATWKQDPPGPAASSKELAALRKTSGVAFERRFVTLLSTHQSEAIALARTESEGGRNRDALALAKQIQLSRTAEIEQLRTALGP
jgi:uncharacterized protein (DUF305 family)